MTKGNRVQKDTKTTKNGQKRTRYMCPEMLRWLRQDINFRPVDMYTSLGIPRRTYQDYEAGNRGIPAEIAAAGRDIHQRNRLLMANVCRTAKLPEPLSGYSAGEWLGKKQREEYEAGIIRISRGEKG